MDKYWSGGAPTKCDTCNVPFKDKFYDAKTNGGPWAFMCKSCQELGPGVGRVGTGYGQEYTKQADGRWLKTAG